MKRKATHLSIDGMPSPDNGSDSAAATDAILAETAPLPSEPPSLSGDASKAATAPKEKTLDELQREFVDLISNENPLARRRALYATIRAMIKAVLAQHPLGASHRVLIMYDNLTLLRQDSDKIYQALTAMTEIEKPIALVINSGGGEVDAGYLIGKLCREFSAAGFIAIVPRRAKSAATLICCGADQIHMGSMSELGPIDPQVDAMPALGLKNAIQHLLELAAQNPGASEVLAKYLDSSLKLIHLGYYERVAESAAQYAERLLNKRNLNNAVPHDQIAKTLVYSYKDHGFVIDAAEAASIFGEGVIFSNSPEYFAGNALYSVLAWIERTCDTFGCHFYFYGSPDSAPNMFKKR
jgi:ClpP class serine protease